MSAATKLQPDDDFGAAFAEPDPDPATTTATTGAPTSQKTEASASAADPGATTTGAADAANQDPAEKPAADPKKVDPPEGTEPKSEAKEAAGKDVNHWRGKAGWLQGQFHSEATRRKAVEEENARLKRELEDAKKPGSAAPAPAADATSASAPKKPDPLSRIEDTLPETASATREAIDQAVESVRKDLKPGMTEEQVKKIVTDAIKPTAEAVASDAAAKHWQAIYEAHSDTDELIKEGSPFYTWRDSLPGWMQPGVNQVLERGTADEVIEVLATYKKTVKPQASTTVSDDKGAKPKPADDNDDTAALAVRTRAAPAIPAGQADQNDFGAAFRSD